MLGYYPFMSDNDYPQFKAGQKVRDIYGDSWVVSSQDGCQVWVKNSNDWFHPTKLFPV